METAQGIVSHSQNTSQVSGGANNTSVTTTYIAMFRLGQRQVEFSGSSPLSVSDGDQVIVAGREWRGTLCADAIRNATTGVVTHSGIFGRAFGGTVVLLIGLVAAALMLAGHFSLVPGIICLLCIAGAAFLFLRASQTSNALRFIKSRVP